MAAEAFAPPPLLCSVNPAHGDACAVCVCTDCGAKLLCAPCRAAWTHDAARALPSLEKCSFCPRAPVALCGQCDDAVEDGTVFVLCDVCDNAEHREGEDGDGEHGSHALSSLALPPPALQLPCSRRATHGPATGACVHEPCALSLFFCDKCWTKMHRKRTHAKLPCPTTLACAGCGLPSTWACGGCSPGALLLLCDECKEARHAEGEHGDKLAALPEAVAEAAVTEAAEAAAAAADDAQEAGAGGEGDMAAVAARAAKGDEADHAPAVAAKGVEDDAGGDTGGDDYDDDGCDDGGVEGEDEDGDDSGGVPELAVEAKGAKEARSHAEDVDNGFAADEGHAPADSGEDVEAGEAAEVAVLCSACHAAAASRWCDSVECGGDKLLCRSCCAAACVASVALPTKWECKYGCEEGVVSAHRDDDSDELAALCSSCHEDDFSDDEDAGCFVMLAFVAWPPVKEADVQKEEEKEEVEDIRVPCGRCGRDVAAVACLHSRCARWMLLCDKCSSKMHSAKAQARALEKGQGRHEPLALTTLRCNRCRALPSLACNTCSTARQALQLACAGCLEDEHVHVAIPKKLLDAIAGSGDDSDDDGDDHARRRPAGPRAAALAAPAAPAAPAVRAPAAAPVIVPAARKRGPPGADRRLYSLIHAVDDHLGAEHVVKALVNEVDVRRLLASVNSDALSPRLIDLSCVADSNISCIGLLAAWQQCRALLLAQQQLTDEQLARLDASCSRPGLWACKPSGSSELLLFCVLDDPARLQRDHALKSIVNVMVMTLLRLSGGAVLLVEGSELHELAVEADSRPRLTTGLMDFSVTQEEKVELVGDAGTRHLGNRWIVTDTAEAVLAVVSRRAGGRRFLPQDQAAGRVLAGMLSNRRVQLGARIADDNIWALLEQHAPDVVEGLRRKRTYTEVADDDIALLAETKDERTALQDAAPFALDVLVARLAPLLHSIVDDSPLDCPLCNYSYNAGSRRPTLLHLPRGYDRPCYACNKCAIDLEAGGFRCTSCQSAEVTTNADSPLAAALWNAMERGRSFAKRYWPKIQSGASGKLKRLEDRLVTAIAMSGGEVEPKKLRRFVLARASWRDWVRSHKKGIGYYIAALGDAFSGSDKPRISKKEVRRQLKHDCADPRLRTLADQIFVYGSAAWQTVCEAKASLRAEVDNAIAEELRAFTAGLKKELAVKDTDMKNAAYKTMRERLQTLAQEAEGKLSIVIDDVYRRRHNGPYWMNVREEVEEEDSLDHQLHYFQSSAGGLEVVDAYSNIPIAADGSKVLLMHALPSHHKVLLCLMVPSGTASETRVGVVDMEAHLRELPSTFKTFRREVYACDFDAASRVVLLANVDTVTFLRFTEDYSQLDTLSTIELRRFSTVSRIDTVRLSYGGRSAVLVDRDDRCHVVDRDDGDLSKYRFKQLPVGWRVAHMVPGIGCLLVFWSELVAAPASSPADDTAEEDAVAGEPAEESKHTPDDAHDDHDDRPSDAAPLDLADVSPVMVGDDGEEYKADCDDPHAHSPAPRAASPAREQRRLMMTAYMLPDLRKLQSVPLHAIAVDDADSMRVVSLDGAPHIMWLSHGQLHWQKLLVQSKESSLQMRLQGAGAADAHGDARDAATAASRGCLSIIMECYSRFATADCLSLADQLLPIVCAQVDSDGADHGRAAAVVEARMHDMYSHMHKPEAVVLKGIAATMQQLLASPVAVQALLGRLQAASLSDWLFRLISSVPMQIARAFNNQFAHVTNGLLREHRSDFSDSYELADMLRFGLLDSLITSWDGPVKVVSSMGRQSTGKSYTLNHLTGSLFNIAGGRCTDGVWMTVAIDKGDGDDGCLVVVLDFEGLGSLERSEQEDMFLSVVNAAISDVTLFKTDNHLDQGTVEMLSRFRDGVDLIKGDARLLKGVFGVVVKDIETDSTAVAQEFAGKLKTICHADQQNNFLTRMYQGQFFISCFPSLLRAGYYRELTVLHQQLQARPASFASGAEFLDVFKLLLASVEIKDWTSFDKRASAQVQRRVHSALVGALRTGGLSEGDGTIGPLQTRQGVVIADEPLGDVGLEADGCPADTGIVLFDVPDDYYAEGPMLVVGSIHHAELLSLYTSWAGDMHSTIECADQFSKFVTAVVSRRLARVRKWCEESTVGLADSPELKLLFADLHAHATALERRWELCSSGRDSSCDACGIRCLQLQHVAHKHDCFGSHRCESECDFCAEEGSDAVRLLACGRPSSHDGRHDCMEKEHHCDKLCALFAWRGCRGGCSLRYLHDSDCRCNAGQHFCNAVCSLPGCEQPCIEPYGTDHERHHCSDTRCPEECAFSDCSRACGAGHFHAVDSRDAPHLCHNEHQCMEFCEAPGLCGVESRPVSGERVFTGRKSTFLSKHTEQVGLHKRCGHRIPAGQLSHEGMHLHHVGHFAARGGADVVCAVVKHGDEEKEIEEGEDLSAWHQCDVRCPTCGYFCSKEYDHEGEHRTAHGSMRGTFAADTGEFTLGERLYGVGDSAVAEMCPMLCQRLGRGHVHLRKCRGGACRAAAEDEMRHETRRYEPDAHIAKDEIQHSQWWKLLGFEDPCGAEDVRTFHLCNAFCSHEEHEAAGGKSYCTLRLWHDPAVADDVEGGHCARGHHYACSH